MYSIVIQVYNYSVKEMVAGEGVVNDKAEVGRGKNVFEFKMNTIVIQPH